METMIGADELIYRIRKNGRASGKSTAQLGREILDVILKEGGSKHIEDQESFWDTSPTARNIDRLSLPKTSEQYLINYDMLPAIYRAID